jgi:hypothetical protein
MILISPSWQPKQAFRFILTVFSGKQLKKQRKSSPQFVSALKPDIHPAFGAITQRT